MKVIFPVMGAENISVSYLSAALKKAGHTVQVAFDRALFDDKQYFSVSWLARIFSEKERMIRAILQAKPDILAQLEATWGDRVFSAREVAEMRAAELAEEQG